jgi:hypothetical protein
MQGTRSDVIALINGWMDDISSPNIFWLKGSPGAGKSAIAATMVSLLRNQRRLGSHFYFKSGDDRLSNPANLWRTFAADLSKFDPSLRTRIIEVLKDQRVDPAVPDIKAHFQCLIHEPLQSVVQSLSRYPVFVIDAFDECSTHGSHRKNLLDSFKRWAEFPCELKLLITSRDHHDIATALRGISLGHVLCTGDLVNQHSSNDIHSYFSTHFHDFATSVGYDGILSPNWPGPAVIAQLTQRAAGLFIWAKTIVNLIEDEDEDPQLQLSLILATSSYGNIDKLYAHILDSAFGKSSSHYVDAFRLVVGGILTARIPLCQSDLMHLLGLTEVDTLSTSVLRKLRSVISAEASDACLRIHHQSFADFLHDSNRCPNFYVIESNQSNETMAANCLKIMGHPSQGLHFNICQFPTSYLSNDAVYSFSEQIKLAMSSRLAYSCQFWLDHICASSTNSSLSYDVNEFFNTRFLYWLEALSLMKMLSIASPLLRLLALKFKVCAKMYVKQMLVIYNPNVGCKS